MSACDSAHRDGQLQDCNRLRVSERCNAYVRAGDEGGALSGKRLVGGQRRDGDATGAVARELLQDTSGLLNKLSGGHQDECFDAAAAR